MDHMPESPGATEYLDALPDAILLLDSSLVIRWMNQAAVHLFGQRIDPSDMPSIDAVIPERHRNTLRTCAKDVLEDHQHDRQMEISAIRADGSELVAAIGLSHLNTSGEPRLLVSIRDISSHRLIESELRTNQVLLAEAQRLAQLGSWRWDLSRNLITWSNELYRIWGVTKSEVPIDFESYLSMIHPDDRDRVHRTITGAIERQESFEIEHRIVRPDGMVRLIYGHGDCARDSDGNVTSMIGTAQDITERKANEAQAFQLALEQAARQEAERSRERFRYLAEVSEALSASLDYQATIDSLIDLIVPRFADWCSINALEEDGTINRIAVAHRDPKKLRILESVREKGYLPHDDPTHPLTRALREGRPELYEVVSDQMLERMVRNPEHLELARRLAPVSYMLVPLVARGKAFGVVTFGTSDSGRKYTEDDLHLATEVTHRAAVGLDNAILFKETQNAARAREEFVSLVSHELKTPLTVIKGYMQVLERYLDRPEWDRERIRKTGTRLSTQVERLELLVADILDVSRIQRGRLELNVEESVELTELAREVMARFDDAIERQPDHQMRVIAEQPVTGHWDPLRLDQVFSNLLSNALKYSPHGGTIEVEISRNGAEALIEVRDEGVGIEREELSQLFQPFQRGKGATRGISGTGLGLYITRQIVEQHGGSIRAQSGSEISTTFEIRLPIDARSDESDQAASG